MELILPILEGGDLDSVTMAVALEHLRTCTHCQREQEHYSALDQAVRDRFGFAPVRPYATEEIMRRITERSQSTEQAAPVALNDSTSQRSTHSARFYRPWLSGLGAVAVVAVLLGMAALLFGGRLGFGVGSGGPPRPSIAGTQGLLADVSMVSPTEGWALAQVTKTPDGKITHNTVTFYHYQNSIWTPVTLTLSARAASTLQQSGIGGFNGSISMDSATDGWAVASDYNAGLVLFHFTGGQWQEVRQGAPSGNLRGIQALSAHSVWAFSGESYNGQPASIFHYDGTTWTRQTIGGVTGQSRLVTLQMASDSLGWALMSASGDYGNPNYTVAQYAGNNTWTVHSSINAGNLGEISGLAMVSPDNGWAFGPRAIDGPSSVTAGKPVPQVLYHYSHGRWQTAPVSLNDGVSFVTLEKIVMRSASDGWIIALDQNQRPGITASGIERHTILLHYDGASWTQAPTPAVGGDASEITGMTFVGDTGWACGYVAALPSGQDIQDDTLSSYGSPMLWSYHDGGWTLYQQK
jgi:hypothetical protein